MSQTGIHIIVSRGGEGGGSATAVGLLRLTGSLSRCIG
jgi:hypothetical protein